MYYYYYFFFIVVILLKSTNAQVGGSFNFAKKTAGERDGEKENNFHLSLNFYFSLWKSMFEKQYKIYTRKEYFKNYYFLYHTFQITL